MKITIDRSELNFKLQTAIKAINTKNIEPIYDNFLFELKEDILYITASNTVSAIITSLSVSVVDSNSSSFMVEAKLIVSIIKTLNCKDVIIDTNNAEGVVLITYKGGKYKIPIPTSRDYPRPKLLGAETIGFTIKPEIIRDGISRTVFATCNDNNFAALSGIKVTIEKSVLSFAATDRYKIASVDNMLPDISADGSFIIDSKTAIIIKDILSKYEDNIDVIFDANAVIFEIGSFIIHSRTIDAKFPNYKGLLVRDNKINITIDKYLLESVVERVALCVDKASHLVRMDISNNKIQMSAQDITFKLSATEELPCSYDGDDIALGLKLDNLSAILDSIKSDEIIFKLNSPKHGCIITPGCDKENETQIMMTMPLALS